MQGSSGLVDWNVPNNQTLVGVAVVFAALFVGALVVEYARQRRLRNRRTAAAWQLVKSIEDEKELSPEERKVLDKLIRRWSSDDPHRAVALRQRFDECVEREMDFLQQKGDPAQYEETGVLLRDIRTRLALDFVPIGQRILSTRELYSGQELWLTRESDTPPQWRRGTVAQVNEAYFHMTLSDRPASSQSAYQEGEIFRFRLHREEDARYAFKTSLVREESTPRGLVFLHTSRQKRIQAREHFRVRHEQTTNVVVMNSPPDRANPLARDWRIVARLRGRITNLSAGGFALIAPQSIPPKSLIRVTLDLELEATEPFEVDAQVIGTTPLPGGRHLVRASYCAVDDERRDIIARYVIHCQQPHSEPVGDVE